MGWGKLVIEHSMQDTDQLWGGERRGKKFIQIVTKVRGMAHGLLGGADAHRQDVICGTCKAEGRAES
jgi:hypothetical protein